MRISVQDKSDHYNIRIPGGLFLNFPAAFGLRIFLKKKGLKIKTRQIYKLMKAIKKHKAWKLIEIESDGGEMITITI